MLKEWDIRAFFILLSSVFLIRFKPFSLVGYYYVLRRFTLHSSHPSTNKKGILLCLIPVLLFDMPHVIRELWDVSDKARFMLSWVFLRYVSIAVINGFAFTSYNLASTYILTRISVVHHAALNCIRRVFAIIVTSIVFRVPITTLSAFGIAVSVGGFFSFSHFKMKRLRRPRPLSSLLPMSEV